MTTKTLPVVLTGDRTTGPLHLGHLAGSLARRVEIQHDHDQTILLADAQALTDNGRDPARIRGHVLDVAADQIACGIDPAVTTMCVQSRLPALDRLSMLLLNLVSVSRLERNPTIRHEIAQKGMERDLPAGFLVYPATQAADILAFKAELVPCGEDQLPMIEQAEELGHRVNRLCGADLLPRPRAMLSRVQRLPGVDGRAKASKSLGNAIALHSTRPEIEEAVRRMFTDPDHVRVADPGRVEGNVVFAHLDAFDPDRDAVEDLKAHYRRGGLGDMALKRRLVEILDAMLAPVRERRNALLSRPDDLMDVLRDGTARADARTSAVVGEIEEAMGLFRF